MIAPSDLSTLQSAANVRSISVNALEDQLEGAVARAINTAANTGETSVEWNGFLSESVKSLLKTNGYEVSLVCDPYLKPVANVYKISWK